MLCKKHTLLLFCCIANIDLTKAMRRGKMRHKSSGITTDPPIPEMPCYIPVHCYS